MRHRWLIGFGMLGVSAALATLVIEPQRLIVYNHSPSMPLGFYRYAGDELRRGGIVDLPLPAALHAYAQRRFGAVPDVRFLKPIGALAGDRVCVRDDTLSINGRKVATLIEVDRAGEPVPRWRGCATLGADEVFTLTTYDRHAIDSRYYGPVTRDEIAGVYVPLWTW